METLITILTGVLVTVATYFILSSNVQKVILGSAILSHAAHLLIMTMGSGLKNGRIPVLTDETGSFVDALPQALILTSIVISFAVTAILLVVAYRTYRATGLDNFYDWRGYKDE
ncbi:Na(+)/H(+) antiporter subunit C [Oceanobacillus piezotolerans]|uniref:Na(+)/H(+) antiporter subunit C n=1 Tax=Oceanobacillus piezotolerans TaxID=2448030 RepID=A0A498D6E3_9BACI|nr:Na(+)/H(+) antiporter subunit C [Oceanobacillus piezotolerans]RLL42724.1 Na(+)/H(+) antiporter subunit C [Oceanobacillus piezotolerans]